MRLTVFTAYYHLHAFALSPRDIHQSAEEVSSLKELETEGGRISISVSSNPRSRAWRNYNNRPIILPLLTCISVLITFSTRAGQRTQCSRVGIMYLKNLNALSSGRSDNSFSSSLFAFLLPYRSRIHSTIILEMDFALFRHVPTKWKE